MNSTRIGLLAIIFFAFFNCSINCMDDSFFSDFDDELIEYGSDLAQIKVNLAQRIEDLRKKLEDEKKASHSAKQYINAFDESNATKGPLLAENAKWDEAIACKEAILIQYTNLQKSLESNDVDIQELLHKLHELDGKLK